ncbi:MAG TPA: hypothetical protein VGF53_01390 [Pseudolabrys sp.]|jgi:hypothetical protein
MNWSTGRQKVPLLRAGVGAAFTLMLVAPAHGDSVRVHKVVQPVIVETIIVSTWDVTGDVECYPFACPFGILPAALVKPSTGLAFVGLEHYCNPTLVFFYRGRILFNTGDLPHHFKSATLVLNAQSVENTALASSPLSRMFETSLAAASPEPLFFWAVSREDLDLKRVTAISHPPDGFDNSGLQGLVTGMVQDNGSFNFTIDVTANVSNWVQDWPSRNQTPLRGFILAEPILTVDCNTTLATYQVQLKFEIEEPDR